MDWRQSTELMGLLSLLVLIHLGCSMIILLRYETSLFLKLYIIIVSTLIDRCHYFQICDRRKLLFPVQPKPPEGFKDYLMNRGTYILAGNQASHNSVVKLTPPQTLTQPLKELFTEQEANRHKLRLQHQVITIQFQGDISRLIDIIYGYSIR